MFLFSVGKVVLGGVGQYGVDQMFLVTQTYQCLYQRGRAGFPKIGTSLVDDHDVRDQGTNGTYGLFQKFFAVKNVVRGTQFGWHDGGGGDPRGWRWWC